jgi:creatinine amidohydrolase
MRNWQDLTWTEFSALPANTVAILPTAAIEQHGPHLPVATDAEINAGILARTATLLPPELPVLVLPMQAIGLSVEHIRFPGTLTGSPETLLAFWTEIGRSVARAGVRRLLFLNSHGGQPQILDLVCRRLRGESGLFAVACSWGRLGLPDGLVDAAERRHGIHGGMIETSLMLRLRPDLVRRDKIQNFRSAWLAKQPSFEILEPEGAVGFGWETQDLNADGALGDASRATSEIGEAILANTAKRLTTLIEELAGFDPASLLRDGPGL